MFVHPAKERPIPEARHTYQRCRPCGRVIGQPNRLCHLERTVKFTIATLIASFFATPASAKQETVWIEKVAVLAIGQGICGVGPEEQAMQIAIGSAMITHAISKDAVIARARKRSHQILSDLDKNRTRSTFCQAFGYYLDKGFPR